MSLRRVSAPAGNVIPFASIRAKGPSPEASDACKIDTNSLNSVAPCKTHEKGGKPSKIKSATKAGSRTGYTVTHNPSRETCTLVSDEDFERIIDAESVRTLRKMFPHEHSCHTAIMYRVKNEGYSLHSDLRSFKSFLRHLRQSPSPQHTVDRIITADKEYAPGKVRWATKAEQAQNRNTSITLPFNGQDLPLPVVADLIGQKPDTLRARLDAGWRKEEVVAGFRVEGAVLTDAGWPSGATPSLWDGPYKGWKTLYRDKAHEPQATRAVFFCWIAGNRIRQMERNLADRYPEHFSDNADPDDDSPPPTEDCEYQSCLQHKELYAEAYALIRQDRAQVQLLCYLQRYYGQVTEPRNAHQSTRLRK